MTTRTLRRRSSIALALGVCALTLNPHAAHAIWPPAADATQEQLAQRENQPNDPGYQGQWDQWSFIPGTTLMATGLRPAEIPPGAGHNSHPARGAPLRARRGLDRARVAVSLHGAAECLGIADGCRLDR